MTTKKLTTEEFIAKAKLIHNNKYDYIYVNYINSKTNVTITCPIHGDFNQIPNSHLRGCGCNSCGYNKVSKLFALNQEELIIKANKLHNNKYDYSKFVYVNAHRKVTITCPVHGDFKQKPRDHINNKHGCPKCKPSGGFNSSKSAYLYYLKLVVSKDIVLYKIGVTNRTISKRFSLIELSKIEVLKQKYYNNGKDALAKETFIKNKYKKYKYKGPNVLNSGNTELFIEDIISLHNENF